MVDGDRESIRLRSKGFFSISILPASILERSRISFTISSKWSPLDLMYSINLRCLSLKISESISISWLNPNIAFSGVLSSWLMLAKNVLFILLISSAASFALYSAVSTCFCLLMSLIMTIIDSASVPLTGIKFIEKNRSFNSSGDSSPRSI